MQLTVKDAAGLLNVAEKTIYRWIQGSGLPAYRVEGVYRINRALLLEWATSHRININPDLFRGPERESEVPSLADALDAGGIFYRVDGQDKAAALKAIVGILRLPEDTDREMLHHALLARESLQSTGIGEGIAIPHVRNPVILDVDTAAITLCFLERPIEFDAIDALPVKILFTFITPTVQSHLQLLSRLSYCLRDSGFRDALQRELSRDAILASLRVAESQVKPPPAGESAA